MLIIFDCEVALFVGYHSRFLGCLPVEQFCENLFAGISIVETQKNIEMLTGC